jgi:G:T-mismatch repair DNA endonuclease (very short patch repair protein)
MVDKLTPEERSKNMGKIRSKNTSPEMIVRKLTHRLGYLTSNAAAWSMDSCGCNAANVIMNTW